ncbi:DUF397 domain-containing protein [Streptomyces sp. NPDC047046]|uniref:DUF397 domain-containing protein n=1 Tax=Streptomyces sp. NPDC047046 TaxID=3155378 RepID=UPI0033D83E7F
MSTTKLSPADLDFSDVIWEKSSYSGGGDNCVELGSVGELVAVRDSKRVDQRPLVFGRQGIAALIAGAKAGSFDRVG